MSSEAWVALGALVVQTILYLFGVLVISIRSDTKQKVYTERLQQDMTDMKQELKKLADVIIQQAVQTTRMDNLSSQVASIDRRVEELRHGNGFVKGRTGVNGEYDG
jgi:hypothetical protein